MEPWLSPLYDAEGMRAVDRWAIEEQGVPGEELMEAAGTALAEAVAGLAPQGPVRIVCGKGNNGGDGLVAERRLRGMGFEVDAVEIFSEETPGNLDSWLSDSGAVVDAIFGTGFAGAPREPAVAAIEAINRCGAPVVACDIASGVDASSGEVEGVAVEADLTVSFHAGKVGQRIAPGKWHTGELRVVPIGIPAGAPGGPVGGTIEPAVLSLLPRRDSRSTKFSSGQVVIAGGSRGLTGAVQMSSLAAIRAGAGYATVAVPADLEPIFEAGQPEVMSVGCPGGDGCLAPGSLKAVLRTFERAAAGVLGPGMGRDPGTVELARDAAAAIEAPLVIDADGLNAFAGELGRIAAREAPTVLTPHAGELGRLLERDLRADQRPPAGLRPRGGESGSARSSCSRATTRSSPTASGSRSTRSPLRRSPRPAPATSSPGSSRRCWRGASTRSPQPAPGSSSTPAPVATPPPASAPPSR